MQLLKRLILMHFFNRALFQVYVRLLPSFTRHFVLIRGNDVKLFLKSTAYEAMISKLGFLG